MGTRGADKKTSSILGSITEVAIKRLSVPVLAIPEDYKFIGEEKMNLILCRLKNLCNSQICSICLFIVSILARETTNGKF